MGPYEANINPMYCKFYYNYKPVIVSSYVEYIMLIPDTINTVKSSFYVIKILPLRLFDFFYPVL